MRFETDEIKIEGEDKNVIEEVKKIFDADRYTDTEPRPYLFIGDRNDKDGLFTAANGTIIDALLLLTVLTKTLAYKVGVTHKSFLKALAKTAKEADKVESGMITDLKEHLYKVFDESIAPKFERSLPSLADFLEALSDEDEESEH